MRTESGSPHVETAAVPVQALYPDTTLAKCFREKISRPSIVMPRVDFDSVTQSSSGRNPDGGAARAVSMPGLTGRLLRLYLQERTSA
jgi:hypothetical protein